MTKTENGTPAPIADRPAPVAVKTGIVAAALPTGLAIAAFIAGAYVFHTVGLEAGRAELATYKEMAKLDLPALSKEARESAQQMNEATAAFKDMLVNNATYLEMKADYDALSTEVLNLRSNYTQSQKSLRDIQDELGRAKVHIESLTKTTQEHEVSESSSVILFGTRLTVAVVAIRSDKTAEMKINGASRFVTAGDIFKIKDTEDNTCEIRVLRVAYIGSNSSFSVLCDIDR